MLAGTSMAIVVPVNSPGVVSAGVVASGVGLIPRPVFPPGVGLIPRPVFPPVFRPFPFFNPFFNPFFRPFFNPFLFGNPFFGAQGVLGAPGLGVPAD
jgi:hypothetical protein